MLLFGVVLNSLFNFLRRPFLHWCLFLVFIRVKHLALKVNELFDKRNRTQQLGVFVLPVPIELDLGHWGSFKLGDLFEVLMLDGFSH